MSESTTISFSHLVSWQTYLRLLGVSFLIKKSAIKVKYWAWNSTGCAASVRTNTRNDFLKTTGDRRYMSISEQIELRELKKKLKSRVQSGTASIPRIYQEELARINRSSFASTLATSANEASKYFVCFDAQHFLHDRIWSESGFMDSPFDTCSRQFEQIYAIHCFEHHQSRFKNLFACSSHSGFPVWSSLLSGKSAEIYRQLFADFDHHTKLLNMRFEPGHVVPDFEMSLIKAMKQKVCVVGHRFIFHFCLY